MALLLWSGNEARQDNVIDGGATLIMWPNVSGNSATTVAPFHQVVGQEGLAGWQIITTSVNSGTNLSIDGDWLYLQVLWQLTTIVDGAEWTLFWMTDVADSGTAYAVGVYWVSGVRKLRLWKKVGAHGGPPTYIQLADGSTTIALTTTLRLNIALSQITDSGDGDYRRIKVYLDDNLEINHQNTDCVPGTQMSLIQQEISAVKIPLFTCKYDHAVFNDDGGSDDDLKGLLGESFAICGYQVKADVDDPNDYSVQHIGNAANMTAGDDGNAWLKDTDEEWKPADEWIGATVHVTEAGDHTFVVTSVTDLNQLNGTGAWVGGTPSSGLPWFVISSTHKKYRAVDDKNEKNPGPASSPRTEEELTSVVVSGGAAQGFAMVDSTHIAGSPASVDGVHVFMNADKDFTLCSGALSEDGATAGGTDQWLNAPEGGAWSISIWDDLQIKFATPDVVSWILMEVAGHRLKTAVPNDNDVAVHSDETGNCPPVVSAFIPRVIIF